jgi:hypothetical protein
MPSGYSAPPLTSLFRPQYKRTEQGPGLDEEVRTVRALRSRVDGFQGCLLTTSRLQRLARGIFSTIGPRLPRQKCRPADLGTSLSSPNRRPITMTGGKLSLSRKGVPAVWFR